MAVDPVTPKPPEFRTDDEARKAIVDLMTKFEIPTKVAWYHVDELFEQGGVSAVETLGEAAMRAAASKAIDAFVFLSHGKAKP